jgi:hypothetical protein
MGASVDRGGNVSVVDAWPAEATLRAVAGDPFAFRLVLRDPEGGAVDVSLWEWRATVTTGRIRLDFEALADEGGVRLIMRGDDTARLYAERAGKPCPFDVACRQPSAGEGSTVLAGDMLVMRRVTDPIRYDPDVAPGREDDLVPA